MMVIAQVDEFVDGECREFAFSEDGEQVECFLVRKNGSYYAYQNSCPHTGATLNWTPGQFLTLEKDLIQCSLHGALFRIEDGYCLHGPCAGMSLHPVAVSVDSGRIVLASRSCNG